MVVEAYLLFFGLVGYSKLVKGVEFEIREGPKIVGEGFVIR